MSIGLQALIRADGRSLMLDTPRGPTARWSSPLRMAPPTGWLPASTRKPGFSTSARGARSAFIDICINNAIQFPSGGNTYAPTEGKCRSARGPSPAGAGPVGHGLVAERSGAPHPVRSQFRPALAAGAAPRGTRRFAGALLAGTPAQVGGEPAAPLGEGAAEGTPGPRLPNATVDHGANRRSHRARVRSALPSRSCRSADA